MALALSMVPERQLFRPAARVNRVVLKVVIVLYREVTSLLVVLSRPASVVSPVIMGLFSRVWKIISLRSWVPYL